MDTLTFWGHGHHHSVHGAKCAHAWASKRAFVWGRGILHSHPCGIKPRMDGAPGIRTWHPIPAHPAPRAPRTGRTRHSGGVAGYGEAKLHRCGVLHPTVEKRMGDACLKDGILGMRKHGICRGMMVCLAVVLVAGGGLGIAAAQERAQRAETQLLEVGPMPMTPLQVVSSMIAHEDDDPAHRDRYEFLSNERSDRTGGHMWTERVVETNQGRVRFLLAVDGKPLTAEQEQQERGRLAGIIASPDAFVAQEKTQKDDEAQARRMLDLLPKAFVFDNVRLEGGVWRMDFHPNPDFAPHGLEERVLYGMSGTVAIDAKQERIVHIDGTLRQDVSIGFGLLATVHAGSHFSSDRADKGGHWRTVDVRTAMQGKAILFKSVSRDSEIMRSEFHYLDPGTTIAQAVALVETAAGSQESSTADGGR